MELQTEATLFTLPLTQVSPYSWFHDHSEEGVSLHPGVWRCVLLSTLAILETVLPITFYYSDLKLYLSDYFILERRTEIALLQEMQKRSGRVRSDPERKSLSKNQVNSSLVGGHSSCLAQVAFPRIQGAPR